MDTEAARGIRDARMALRSAVTVSTARWRGLFTIDASALRLVAPIASRGDLHPSSASGRVGGRPRMELDAIARTVRRPKSRIDKTSSLESRTDGMVLQASALRGDTC